MREIGYIYSRILKKIRGVAKASSSVHLTSKVEAGSTIINTQFDRHSFCGYDCTINNCEIGSFTSIASRVVIGGSRHPIEFASMSPVFLSHKDSVKAKFAKHNYHCIPKTVIGNDVWIGEGVFVKAGVTVGDGAVVGMGSIVTKDVPPYSIYAGNPARQIRMRFDKNTIEAFLKWKWWNLSDKELKQFGPFFNSPEELLKSAGFL